MTPSRLPRPLTFAFAALAVVPLAVAALALLFAAPLRAMPSPDPAESEAPAALDVPASAKQRPSRQINLETLEVNEADYTQRLPVIGSTQVLDLARMEREAERRWSLQLSAGAGQTNIDGSISRVKTMEGLGRFLFAEAAAGQGLGLFDFGWTDEGASEPSGAFRLRGDFRYRPVPLVTLEAEVGRSGAQSAFAQPGYRFDENSNVLDASVGALVTLPWRIWRFGLYAGGGVGLLRGTLTSQLFIPSFTATPQYLISRATGSAAQFNLKGGGELYLTRFMSFTLEGEYRNAKIDKLKYDDDAQLKGAGETDTPCYWVAYEGDIIAQFFQPIADPSRPVSLDFSGLLVTGGLRYHF